MPRELRPFLVIVWSLIIAAMAMELVNGRFWLSDLRVYWGAADALVHGQPMYGRPFGEDTGFFKYAPVVAYAFAPMALIPFKIVALLWFLLSGVALSICFVRMERLLMRHVFHRYPRRVFLRALLGLMCIVVLLTRELHLGNINLWLVVCMVLASEGVAENNSTKASIWFAVALVIKPYMLAVLIPMAITQRWRTILRTGLLTVAILALPLLIAGPWRWWTEQQAWIHAMAEHGQYLSSPDTVSAMIAHCTGLANSGTLQLISALCTLMIVAVAGSRLIERHRPLRDRAMPLLWLTFACVPNLVITDLEHFLFALPLILFTLAMLFQQRSPLATGVFVLAMLCYATRSTDLLGNALFDRTAAWGVLGLGNLLLLLSSLLARPVDRDAQAAQH